MSSEPQVICVFFCISESGDLSDTARILVNEAFEECDINQVSECSALPELFSSWFC